MDQCCRGVPSSHRRRRNRGSLLWSSEFQLLRLNEVAALTACTRYLDSAGISLALWEPFSIQRIYIIPNLDFFAVWSSLQLTEFGGPSFKMGFILSPVCRHNARFFCRRCSKNLDIPRTWTLRGQRDWVQRGAWLHCGPAGRLCSPAGQYWMPFIGCSWFSTLLNRQFKLTLKEQSVRFASVQWTGYDVQRYLHECVV